MDISFQPKSQVPEEAKPLVNVTEAIAGVKGLYIGEHKSIVTIIFTILPFLVGGAIFGMTMVNESLKTQVAVLKADIEKKDSQITKVPMKDIKQLSDRVQVVSQVIKGQAFMTSFLKVLEYSVEDDVTFQKTALSTVTNNGKVDYTFTIEAKATTYAAVLNQFQTLRDTAPYNKFFSDIKMQNFAVDKKGAITFKIVGSVAVKGITPEEAELQLSGKTNVEAQIPTGSQLTPQASQNTTP